MNDQSVVSVENVSFSYNGSQALHDTNYAVQAGNVVGLLGPNGAGKTTSVRLLNGLLRPDRGTIRVLGMDPTRAGDQIRMQAGVLTEVSALYERLSAWQNLFFFGGLHGLSDAQVRQRGTRLLEFFDLADRADQRVDTYSKGMRQRLALVRVLIHEPQLLYLDEPTSGLDPEAAKKVIDLMLEFRREEERTMLICTHNLTVAERLCDRLLIMKKGRVLANGSLEELRARFAPGWMVDIRLQEAATPALLQALAQHAGVNRVEAEQPQSVRLSVQEQAVIPAVIQTMTAHGALILAVVPIQKSLEDVYLTLQEEVSK